jgi:catechol O-methyltransferase
MMRGAKRMTSALLRPACQTLRAPPASRGIVNAESMGTVMRVTKEHWSSFMFGRERQLLFHVVKTAEEGNVQSVLEAMDTLWAGTFSAQAEEFSWNARGETVRKVMQDKLPKRCVEVGTYCGYSALLIARELPEDGFLVSIEVDPLFAAIATKIVEHAGMAHKVKIFMGDVEFNANRISKVFSQHSPKDRTGPVDFILCDHSKELFVPDLKVLEEAGVAGPGTVVMGDTTSYPGFAASDEGGSGAATDLLTYFANNPRYRIQTHIGTRDQGGITVSEWMHLP